jgi:hypothetical protein
MYTIKLSSQELADLDWLAGRGYFPTEIIDSLILASRDENGKYITYHIPEHAAWSLLELRENDPDAYLTCMGGELLDKVLKLEAEIV